MFLKYSKDIETAYEVVLLASVGNTIAMYFCDIKFNCNFKLASGD